MAKKANDMALAPSAGEGWDAWGAACGFTSWAKAAEAIGITVAQMVTIRKKVPRKTIRLAMDAVLAAQPRAVPDAYVGELIEAATEVYRISDREHEAWRRLRAALVAARKAQRPRVSDAAVEPVTQGEQVSPPRYSYGADDSVMLLNPEDSTYTRGPPAASPAGVPDGWVLVPVEPTDDMLAQACTHDTAPRNDKTDQWNRDTWAFMLAAAPQPGESQS